MSDLALAISANGPALGFGELSRTHVPGEISVVIATSGSTGIAKEVGICASALLASARASHAFLEAKPGQRWSLLLPMKHIAAINILIRSIDLGTLPLDLRSGQEYEDADFTAIVPTQLFRALNGDAKLLSHLKNAQAVLVGGAALPDAIAHQANVLGIRTVSTYGMTETSGGCVYNNSPLAGVEISTTSQGLIAIKGPMLASTYLNDQKGWNQSMVNGAFITNDVGTVSDGKVYVEGREDDVIITGGEKISLASVEAALSAKFILSEFAAFSVADAEWGQALHIAIAGKNVISQAAITMLLSQIFGDFAKPKGFLVLASLPKISIGKIDRKALEHLAIHQKQMK